MMDIPHNPQSKTQAFAQLTSEGMAPDAAFVALAIVVANTAPSALDPQHMAEIRELVAEYARHTGQESLMVARD